MLNYCSSLSRICVPSSTCDFPSWARGIPWEKLLLGTCSHNALVNTKTIIIIKQFQVSRRTGLWFLSVWLLKKDFKMSCANTHKEQEINLESVWLKLRTESTKFHFQQSFTFKVVGRAPGWTFSKVSFGTFLFESRVETEGKTWHGKCHIKP